jgi:hypothetical protein
VEHAVAVTIDHPIAAVAGLVAMVCYASWPLCGSRSSILVTYIANNLAFMLHYALLAQWTAVAMNGILALQTVLAMHLVKKPQLRWVYYSLLPVLVAGSVFTWRGAPSLLAGAAAALSTLGRLQTNETSLRVWLLASAPFWLAHDVIVGSLPGQVADVLSMACGAVVIAKRSPVARTLLIGAVHGASQAGKLLYSVGRKRPVPVGPTA